MTDTPPEEPDEISIPVADLPAAVAMLDGDAYYTTVPAYAVLAAALLAQTEDHPATIVRAVRKAACQALAALKQLVDYENDPDPADGPSNSEIRSWAKSVGINVNEKGRIPNDIRVRYEEAHR